MARKRVLIMVSLFAAAALAGFADFAVVRGEPGPKAQAFDREATGEIVGRVRFEGAAPKLEQIVMDQDPVCAARHADTAYQQDGEVNSNGTLPNAFVYVKEGADKYTFPVPSKPAVLDQRGCMYHPHVLGIMAGQELLVVSSDPTTHNIHPMPKDNREWNQSQPPGAPPLKKKFARPEIMVPVKCNQHPWMHAYIGVTRNPFYAVTGREGTFTIKGLPPGDYTLEAWTATFGTQEQKVTVTARKSTTADFRLTTR